METRNCPKCGRPVAFLPARDLYFCNYCRLPLEAAGGGPQPAPGPDPPSIPEEIPPELAGSLPAAPPSEVTLYLPTSDPKPIVRRSSLRKGTVEALAESETSQAVRNGDYLILSKPGRCALVAARKAFGQAPIEPLALEMPGEPWRIRISPGDVRIEAGLFRARPPGPPPRFAPTNLAPPPDFHIAYLMLKGPPPKLASYVATVIELLQEQPWASKHWNDLSRALNQPSSKLMLDWKQYLDYAGARQAAAEVARAQERLRETQRSQMISRGAESAIERARTGLARGEWESARTAARQANDELAAARAERERLGEVQEKVKLALEKVRKLDPTSREAARLEEQMTAASFGPSIEPAQARSRMEALLQDAGRQLFSLHAARANNVLSGIQGEDDALVGEIRECLEKELANGRKNLEEGEVEEGDGILDRAIAAASERIDEFLQESAQSSVQELGEAYENSKDNPALGPEFRVRMEHHRREMDAHLQSGRNKEAGQLARALKREVEDRLERSAPEIRIAITGPRLTADSWNKVVLNIQNSGNADAANVVVGIDGPVELRAMDDLPLLRAGETYKDEIAVRCEENGSIPVKLQVDCERPHDSAPFHFEAELWLEFQKSLDLSGAKTITIDRSVHIVDSVLNRSSVGEEAGTEGLPVAVGELEKTEDGKAVIQDSIINRTGGERPRTGAAERKCPTCGRMISTEWKRCPYCA